MRLYEHNSTSDIATFYSRFDDTCLFTVCCSADNAREINEAVRQMERLAYRGAVAYLNRAVDEKATEMMGHLSMGTYA